MKRIILILQMALLLVGAASCSDSETGNGLAAEPELISIIPISGASGCTAIISGVNFAAEQSANKVLLDGQEAQVVSSSKNRIQIVTPEHADGKVDVKVSVNGKEVSGLDFTYVTLADPEIKITALRPSFGFVGDNVTIIGENFSDEVADMSVTFDGVKANILTTSSSALSVTAPEHARGRVTVEVKKGAKTAVAEFTYVELMVEKSTPSEGGAGTIVTIYGEGFSEELANNVVMVGDQVLTVTEATATTLKVEMPALGTGTYTFTVKVGERVCTGGSFTVAPLWYVETVAGSVQGTKDGIGKEAKLEIVQHLAMGPDGKVWFTSRGAGITNSIRTLDPKTWEVKTVIGTVNVLINNTHLWGSTFDSKGNYYATGKAAGKVFKIAAGTNEISVLPLPAHKLTTNPMCVLTDAQDNLYLLNRDAGTEAKPSYISVYDKNLVLKHDWPVKLFAEHMAWNKDKTKLFIGTTGVPFGIFEFDPATGEMKKIAGTDNKPTSAANTTDGDPGNPLTATIGQVDGIAVDAEGNLWFSDVTTATVRVLVPGEGGDYTKGTVKTRAGMNFVPKYPGVDGLGTNAGLKYPCGLLPMPDGSMLLADGTGYTIRRIYSK
ncbi:MAG: IPT/TIG domain-containing protein [Candidatus Cryptobacteroides sp.]|nr:IPT/TIG domain-containing protein [Bacteroides sp.]MDY5302697.1 IPT/TIG domain-containing protein [Candidatus Cryptobacteroides sp.]